MTLTVPRPRPATGGKLVLPGGTEPQPVRYVSNAHDIRLNRVAWGWVQRGAQQQMDGDLWAAVASYRQAAAADPDEEMIGTNVISVLDMLTDDPEIRMAERSAYDERFCLPLTRRARPHANDRDPERRLRVGYLSGDFYAHSAANSFLPVVAHHDPRAVETYLYSTLTTGDLYTEGFRAATRHFRDVGALTTHQLAEAVRRDRIDVLVELSAYTHGNRLLALAEKPAPIQITGWGYTPGTGLACMDYLVSDATATPPSHERYYRERIMRLPCLVAYAPMLPGPPVGPPPCDANGYTTFGYLGRPMKLSQETLIAWAAILRRVEGSRLYLKHQGYRNLTMAHRVLDTLSALGVDPANVDLAYESTRYEHNAAYNLVDLALDCWPENGGATILDACSMGVPTVTRLGTMVSSRQSSSILKHAGITETIDTVGAYVDRAVAWAGDRAFLRRQRLEMPGTFLRSPICQPARYAAAWEDELRSAWRRWCAEMRGRP